MFWHAVTTSDSCAHHSQHGPLLGDFPNKSYAVGIRFTETQYTARTHADPGVADVSNRVQPIVVGAGRNNLFIKVSNNI